MVNQNNALQHTASHIMTMAVKMLYPEISLGVGPWIDNGFYQDFDFQDAEISSKNFKNIEKKMRWIINKNFAIKKFDNIDETKIREIFQNDKYKTAIIDEIIKNGEKITVYDFINEKNETVYRDVCAGPHLSSTGKVGAFMLTKIAGAYWRGDEKNEQLTRIYGIAFENEEEKADYQKFLIEAEKRDHRKLGKELGLYTINPDVGLGLPLWKPAGAFIISKIRRWFEDVQISRGYMPVYTPHIGRKKLWEQSGHWGFYNDSMYPPIEVGQTLAEFQDSRSPKESEIYLLKPMNCPFHIAIYNDDLHSYRDLPMKLYEFGTVYRYEQKGELGGLTRVRGFTQDDAHIICSREQITQEMENILDLAIYVLQETFGLKISISASFRDPKNDKYLGSDEDWEIAENVIREILKKRKIEYKEEIGEAAFYGPKMDFKVQDSLGRQWQLSTIQFDFNLPNRFDMKFINKEGKEERPLVVHRAMLGSIERFMGILIEHYAGAFPTWLAPIQAHILPVNEAHSEYANKISREITQAGGRVKVFDSSESLGKRIRNSVKHKIPYSIVIGDTEVENNSLTIRKYGEDKDKTVSFDEFIKLLK